MAGLLVYEQSCGQVLHDVFDHREYWAALDLLQIVYESLGDSAVLSLLFLEAFFHQLSSDYLFDFLVEEIEDHAEELPQTGLQGAPDGDVPDGCGSSMKGGSP